MNSSLSDLMGYYSWAKKKIQVYCICWSMNSAQNLQILAKKQVYRICWRYSKSIH